MSSKQPKRTFVLQHDQSDCGVACLLSLVQYYGGQSTLERLRELSGTARQGTSLLGLYQAASVLGFTAEGCEADSASLIGHGKPVILHTLVDGQQEHYVVCYGYEHDHFIVGDPAKGIVRWSREELAVRWQSKACLTLEPNSQFQPSATLRQAKKEWLLRLIRDDAGLLGISLVLGLLVASLGMAMAIFSQKLIDDILPGSDYKRLAVGITLLSILLCARLGVVALRQHLLLTQARHFNNRIISLFYKGLLYLPKLFFDTRKVGDMTARLNDTRRIQTVISQTLGDTVINALVVLVSFALLFSYSYRLAFVAAGCTPLFFLIIFRHNRHIISRQKEVMAGYALSESNFISTIQGVSTIKNFGKEEAFAQLNQQVYGIFQARLFSLGLINIRLGWQSNLVATLALIGILSYGSVLVLGGSLKLGELMAVLGIAGSLLPSVAALAMVAVPLNEAAVAFNRMFEFMSIQPEQAAEQAADTATLRLSSLSLIGVSFRYPGRKRLLADVTLQVSRGELVSIAGESGCGKSTICQLIERFYTTEGGQLLVNGSIPLDSIPIPAWRRLVGVVPQDIHLFNGTVLDNVCLDDAQEEVGSVVKFCAEYGFEDFVRELPQGLLTLIGEEGINLSGGQRQMVGLMRALYKKPQLLILDEATSAMDRRTERRMLDLLTKLKNEMAILFISHRLHILKSISDRIYIVEKGSIQASGQHGELMENSELYREYMLEVGG